MHSLLSMNKNKSKNNTPKVSPIIETTDETGRKLLGFTIILADASFENTVVEFTKENHDQVYAELKQLRMKKIKSIK